MTATTKVFQSARAIRVVTAALIAVALVAALVGGGDPAQAAVAVRDPAAEVASTAIVSPSSGRTDLFARAGDGSLRWWTRPAGGSWSRAVPLGGVLTSQPAAASDGAGRVDVVGRGADGALWRRSLRGGRWSGWTSLGGALVGGAGIAASGTDRLIVAVVGTDGAVWQRSQTGTTTWSGWQRLGASAASTPALVSWGPGRIDAFVRDTSDRLVHAARPAATSAWTAWQDLGGALTSQPAAASPGLRQLDVVVRGGDGGYWLKRYAVGSGWSPGWRSIGGVFTSGPGAADDRDDVLVHGRAGAVREARRTSPTAAWSPWRAVDGFLPFRGLGTWVDVFDYDALSPPTAVANMSAQGVRTLYLSTGRFTDGGDLHDAAEAGAWLDAAHDRGMKVVGWYVPAYGNMDRDVRRTLAIASFVSPGGQRFDAVGVDIERLDEVSRATFNTRLVTHLDRVRAGTTAMIGAIVPSPFTTEPGNNWAGFPWSAVGARSEVVLPMVLWSFRSGLSASGVYAYVLDETRDARALTGRPVHVEGGVDGEGVTPVTPDRVQAFVNAVRDGGAIGGSQYDYRTTDAELWPILRGVNAL